MKSGKIRVLLADDHTIFRQGLRALLEGAHDLEIVGESATGEETIELSQRLTPHVVVMDIGMPGLNGIQATSLIRGHAPSVKVLILSMSGDEESIDQAIGAGISGYLVKDTVADELIEAIRAVNRGLAFFSPVVSKILLEMRRKDQADPRRDMITFREKQILQFIADGKTTKQIAQVLSISPKTVDNHRQHLMEKLDIHDDVSLARYALDKGIVK